MTRIFAAIALGLMVAMGTVSGDAEARRDRHDRHDDGSFAIYIGPDEFGIYIDGGHDDHWRHNRHNYHRRDRWDRHSRWDSSDRWFGHWYAEPTYFNWDRHDRRYRHGRDCHPVTKYGYHRGRPALIGATMCYKRNGNSYIVKGSRHLIRYVRHH